MNLVLLAFRGPFWVQLLLAAGIVWAGFAIQEQNAERAASRAALLASPPPETIPVAEVRGKTGSVPVEVSVRAQVALDHNVRLVRRTNFVKTGENLLYILVDPEAGKDVKIARAGIVIDPDQLDSFAEFILQHSVAFGAAGPVIEIGGLRSSEAHASHAKEAIGERGLTLGPDFFFVEPFIAGREASLAAIPSRSANDIWPFFAVAAAFVAVALYKLSRRGNSRAPVPGIATAAPMPVAAMASDPPTALQKAPRRRIGVGSAVLLLVLGIVAYAVATEDFRLLIYPPMILFWYGVWLLFVLLRRGARAATGLAGRVSAKAVGATAKAGPAKAAAAMPWARRSLATDDPFDRLARIVRDERCREAARSAHPAE